MINVCAFIMITSNNFSGTVGFNLFKGIGAHSLGLLVCFMWFILCFLI